MPGMDKTGPYGTGPIGRGMGPCGDGFAYQRGGGRGMGRGFRRGGGASWSMMPTTFLPDEERGILEQQKDWLEAQLAAITQRLQGFEENKD